MREFSMSEKLMYMKANLHEDIYISVNGISMLPTLNQGDIVCTSAQEVYSVGDIVVFFFHKFVLIHRIIDINQGKILCKGDNAFAAEEIDNKKIIGKVTYVNQVPILQWPTILISFSYRINLLFNTERSIDKVKKTMVYSVYKKLLKSMAIVQKTIILMTNCLNIYCIMDLC